MRIREFLLEEDPLKTVTLGELMPSRWYPLK